MTIYECASVKNSFREMLIYKAKDPDRSLEDG